jgi:ATP-dependent DNA helicase DinG
MDESGEIAELARADAAARARGGPAPLVCHMPATARRLGLDRFGAFDLLELFAFIRPAAFCLPTPRGVAAALGLAAPQGLAEEARSLAVSAERLLAELAGMEDAARDDAAPVAGAMAAGGWIWGAPVLTALGTDPDAVPGAGHVSGLEVWRGLPEWPQYAPEPPPGNEPVDPAEARARLAALIGPGAEARPQQADYASAVTAAFLPRESADVPRVVLAEAGTGVGKTLGYVAPASLWAEKNGGAVWLSTFTRNLQHQIDQELDRLYPDPEEKARRVVIRKGRENYLCLLNLEEAVNTARVRSQDAVALGLIVRWAARTRDGAMTGGDFPGWLADLTGRGRAQTLTDHRGECIYSACGHYDKCFIEHSIRKARRARIVIANHALVMIQAALGGGDEAFLPQRYVFDEGHHLFAAADSAFSGHLTGQEAADLRRWLRGAERSGRGGRSRARGLANRAGDLAAGDNEAEAALDATLKAALALPGEGWLQRLAEGQHAGPAESYLALVRAQVYARAPGRDSPYGLETDTAPPIDGLAEAAVALDGAIGALMRPMAALAKRLAAQLEDDADELDSPTRSRIEAVCRGLLRRGEVQLGGWRSMLRARAGDADEDFVDWFAVERYAGRDMDVGLHRHWIDPTLPFADNVVRRAHGVVITSATLRDGSGDAEQDWRAAEVRTGAPHLPEPALRAAVLSPFDYAAQTRVFVVTDVRKDDFAQVAAAYRELFLAAGGGGLGLFTAITRLREVHGRIAEKLEKSGMQLLAQHVDGLDVSTLVDIFRAEPDTCLLGTDAVRDGVDVPGRALRLIVFDRVPWSRPDILHRARRAAFGGRAYDDMLTRLKIKQAYGRLVRRADDHGVFVMLDPMLPSRLLGAFPEGVEVRRIGLAEAVAETRAFLAGQSIAPPATTPRLTPRPDVI